MENSIVIVSNQYSIVLKVVEKKLTSLGYDVSTVAGDDLQTQISVDGRTYLLYLPVDVMDSRPVFDEILRLSDILVKNTSDIVLIGEKKYHKDFIDKMPSLSEFPWVDRPLDLHTLMAAIKHEKYKDDTKNVLIVDDDPSYARIVKTWIKDFYKVAMVNESSEVVSFLSKNNVDLILLDYEMPGFNGPQVFRMIKEKPELAEIPIVFLTGVSSEKAVSELNELNGDGYFLKNTSRDKLLNKIKEQF
ncbi:MAG: response regulator [Lachnospiraceae bacterium]|jgi:CheY-like chemotaxis protein|nr:response regulator [Lachnospiraceae bacterium]